MIVRRSHLRTYSGHCRWCHDGCHGCHAILVWFGGRRGGKGNSGSFSFGSSLFGGGGRRGRGGGVGRHETKSFLPACFGRGRGRSGGGSGSGSGDRSGGGSGGRGRGGED